MIIEIISHTPLYVWALLGLLLQRSWNARKTHVNSWQSLIIMPVIMLTWSIYSTVTHYESLSLYLWAASTAMGVWLGSLTVRKLPLRFDKEKNLIEIAGNWTPMILSMSIFSLRYFIGTTYSLYPDLKGNPILLALENAASAIAGMFMGRLLGYWRRSKTAPAATLER